MSDPAATIGMCRKIQNMEDGTCRMWVDIPKERTPGDVFTWLFQNVAIAVVDKEMVPPVKESPEIISRAGRSARR